MVALLGRRLQRTAIITAMVCMAVRAAVAHQSQATGGMAVTVHPLATQAAVATIQSGGNAVDAAIAAALMLGVVDPHNSGIGGGCFILIRLPSGEFVAIDGRETAPAKATRDMYLRNGEPDSRLSQTGPLAVATPGALAAYELAVRRHGRLPLRQALLRAAAQARAGFVVDRVFAGRLRAAAPLLRRFPESRRILLRRDGSPYAVGDHVEFPELARTYEAVAEHGVDWFYRGPFARRVSNWMAQHGGLLSSEDFANYRAIERQPVRTRYREYEVVGFPPPSSGGVHVAQILNMLECFDLRELHRRDPAVMTHVVIEAMKRAFADRAFWLGDPEFTGVPRGLVERDYARELAATIRLDRATPVGGHGTPPRAQSDLFSRHTTHLAVADQDGTWVAITQTINTTYGSKVVVPGTGVMLNNEMDDFAIAPGVPNAFGLVGADANAVAAGKRPLSSMSPTIVLKNGKPVLTVGAAGGPKIITQVVLTTFRHLDLQWPLEQAVSRPRYHHQWKPDHVFVERGLDAKLVKRLEQFGHALVPIRSSGVTQAIRYRQGDQGQPRWIGVADPRTAGMARGWPARVPVRAAPSPSPATTRK